MKKQEKQILQRTDGDHVTLFRLEGPLAQRSSSLRVLQETLLEISNSVRTSSMKILDGLGAGRKRDFEANRMAFSIFHGREQHLQIAADRSMTAEHVKAS